MSNFFVRLAQRTLGQHEPVRPLTPSRHADPVPRGAPGEIINERLVPPGASDYRSTPAATAPAIDRMPDAESAPAMTATPVQRPAPAAADHRGRKHRLDHPAATEPSSLASPPSAPSSPTSSRSANADAKSVSAPADVTAPSAIQPRPQGPHRQAPTDMPAPPRAPAELSVPGPMRSRLPPGIEVEPIDPTEPDASTRPLRHALRARLETGILPASTPDENPDPVRARHDGTNPSPPAAVADPVIEVHIGRIEVHAAPQPATAPVEGPRKPGLSLADYLEMRNGGGR